MATITYSDGNQGIWLLRDLYDFERISETDTQIELMYPHQTAYDPTQHPWTYTLTLSNPVSETQYDPGTGLSFDAYTGGFVTAITAFDPTGVQLAQIGDLNLPLDILGAYERMGFGDAAQKFVYSGGHTITGSDNSGPSFNGLDGDNIRTGAQDDTVSALRGDDVIFDAGGTDYYRGGKGLDVVTYENWFFEPHLATQGVTADLNAGTAIGPDANTDTLVSIEGLGGSFLDDTLKGTAGDNVFFGMQGDDFFNGRAGFDIVDYSKDAQQGGTFGIKANLKHGVIRDGFHNDDTVRYVEGVRGTAFDDLIRDDGKDNYLEGGAGWDVLKSAGGDDTLSGGTEDDFFVFIGDDFGHDKIIDWDEFDFIRIENAANFGELTITQNGTSAEIEWNGNIVELLDTDATGLSEFSDFVFS